MSRLSNGLLCVLALAIVSGCDGEKKTAATPTTPAAGKEAGGKEGAGKNGPSPTNKEMPPPEVDVMTVARSDATLTQDLPARLQAYRTAQVRARVDGIVDKRLFSEGSEVKQGASLFQINARVYQANVDAAKADIATARQVVERYKPLLEIKAISQQEFEAAENKLKQAQAVLVRAEEDLNNAHVPAPISGHIGRTLVTEGALVSKNEATQLAVIEQLDPIYVNFTQSNSEMLRLKHAIQAGKMKRSDANLVELLMEDGSSYPQKGKIFFTDMSVDANTGAITMRAEFANPNRELLPGMFVRLRFPQAIVENTFRIPQKAVLTGVQGQSVMIVGPDNKATPQPIKTSGMSGTDFIVSDGLKGGEQVIVNGLQKAKPGTVVKVAAGVKDGAVAK